MTVSGEEAPANFVPAAAVIRRGLALFGITGRKAHIFAGTPVAKAADWSTTDAEVRKRGEQTGLDTLVVHAVNDEC
ncbi:hypothetical protein Lal_00001516 [Lupinus albus]|nr:hypothetical protein Lal_00001516 [Lupinus albus]